MNEPWPRALPQLPSSALLCRGPASNQPASWCSPPGGLGVCACWLLPCQRLPLGLSPSLPPVHTRVAVSHCLPPSVAPTGTSCPPVNGCCHNCVLSLLGGCGHPLTAELHIPSDSRLCPAHPTGPRPISTGRPVPPCPMADAAAAGHYPDHSARTP